MPPLRSLRSERKFAKRVALIRYDDLCKKARHKKLEEQIMADREACVSTWGQTL